MNLINLNEKATTFMNFLGLFHKAIMQSGVSINPWAFQFSNKEFGIKIADELGYSSSDSKDVVEFLQTIPAEKIIEIQTKSTHLRVRKF